jgi:hypothetical protein
MSCTIEVTEEDIKNGKAGDCENCPVALCIKESISKQRYFGM